MQQLLTAVAAPRRAIAPNLFGTLPGLAKTYAPDPVWRDSARGEVRFFRIAKREAWAAYRKLKAWSAAQPIETRTITRKDGKTQVRPTQYGGGIGSACLRVYECLVFDFLNFRNGRLDPSYEGIAKRTGLGRSTVAAALRRLKQLRVISWQRRCTMHHDEQRGVRFEQETNAYAVLPSTQWLGYEEPPTCPAPHPTTWGAVPALDIHTEAEAYANGDRAAYYRELDRQAKPGSLEAVLARMGAAIEGRKSS